MSNLTNPLTPQQNEALARLTTGATTGQLAWLSGFFSGLSHTFWDSADVVSKEASQTTLPSLPQLTILYGSHTGHSQQLAKELEVKVKAKGIETKVSSLEEYKPKQISGEANLAVIVSTHGEGEPPIMAEDFHSFIRSKKAPRLENLKYSVLALGDKSYKFFCQTGVDIAEAFAKLGATELQPVVKCDVDYEEIAAEWIDQLVNKLVEENSTRPILAQVDTSRSLEPKIYSKKNPFLAEVISRSKITGRHSDKEVYHLELSLANSGISYEPGDAIGVFSDNPPELVNAIVKHLGFDPETEVHIKPGKVTIQSALLYHFEITLLTNDIIAKYAELIGSDSLKSIIEDDAILDDYLYGHDLLDLLQEFPSKLEPAQLLSLLRYLPPRLYSISSSADANEDEVHITVAKVDFQNNGRKRVGACSSFLADRIADDVKVPIYIEQNINFRLPSKIDAPVIMIGAGTGVAPYRAFVQQFEHEGRKNNSWLFYGDRTFSNDFLYQLEWQKHLQKGALGKIELAFSRDQQEKIYIQHRIEKQGNEFYQWLEKGAHVYICGDRKKLFRDVQNTILKVIQEQGGITEEKAQEYLKKLKKQKRYQVDVY